MPKYGGIGGQGGAVYFEAKEEVTLKNVLHKFSNKRVLAGNGEDANKERILGRRGADVKVQVPVGITVIDENGTALGEFFYSQINFQLILFLNPKLNLIMKDKHA